MEHWSGLLPDLPVDVYQVTGRISRIATRVAQRQDEIFGHHRLNRGDVGVLGALVTKRLDRLEQRGLVKRKPDPRDRRGVVIQLTNAGRRAGTKAVAENTRSEASLLKGLSAKDRQVLGDLLGKVLGQTEPPSGG